LSHKRTLAILNGCSFLGRDRRTRDTQRARPTTFPSSCSGNQRGAVMTKGRIANA